MYRLLEIGEQALPTDEYFDPAEQLWKTCSGWTNFDIIIYTMPVRRKMDNVVVKNQKSVEKFSLIVDTNLEKFSFISHEAI